MVSAMHSAAPQNTPPYVQHRFLLNAAQSDSLGTEVSPPLLMTPVARDARSNWNEVQVRTASSLTDRRTRGSDCILFLSCAEHCRAYFFCFFLRGLAAAGAVCAGASGFESDDSDFASSPETVSSVDAVTSAARLVESSATA